MARVENPCAKQCTYGREYNADTGFLQLRITVHVVSASIGRLLEACVTGGRNGRYSPLLYLTSLLNSGHCRQQPKCR
ncbi:hypothetical protein GOBAR_DD13237 [Gossypium barbadense]|nr:hypothetical protein GOBAR_DD13237 [Gossypium barbadense]